DKVKIEDVNLSNTTDFSISTDKTPTNINTQSCNGKIKYFDFTITNISGNCDASTDVIIEGVDAFDVSKELPLGIIVKKSGVAKIKPDASEHLESNMPIYIKDALTGETNKINSSPFEVYLENGIYNNRFKLVFQSNQAKFLTANEIEKANLFIHFDAHTSSVKILNKNKIDLLEVSLYNLLGQEVKSLKLNTASDTSMPVSVIAGAYIVNLKTARGIIVRRKIVMER
ncbi:MAG TPA: T9SS type A sorting domain-containing protein, partial [Mariniflexile sp.]